LSVDSLQLTVKNPEISENLGQLLAVSCLLLAALLRFLVRLVLAATVTELLELQTASGRLLVLGR
jgi:hypothetical protein